MRTGLLTALENPSLNLNHSRWVWLDTAPTPPACKHEAKHVQTRISIQSHSVEEMMRKINYYILHSAPWTKRTFHISGHY